MIPVYFNNIFFIYIIFISSVYNFWNSLF